MCQRRRLAQQSVALTTTLEVSASAQRPSRGYLRTDEMEATDGRVAALIRKIVAWLVAQNFGAIDGYSRGVRLSASQISQAIHDYGRTLVMPPEVEFAGLDAIPVQRAILPTWSVRFGLWTEEEGRSDLTLECTLIDRGGETLDVEIDNLHVL